MDTEKTPKSYSVLIIDDHPLIMEAYQSALFFLSSMNDDIEFEIDTANNCEIAYKKIIEAPQNNGIDLIFLDISLPPSIENHILSGEDLGLEIREKLPNSKIIVSTSFSDNFRIQNIFKNINPEGFLIKSDLTPKELVNAIQTILDHKTYYGETVMQFLRKQVGHTVVLDKIDRKMLYELSLGTRMGELAKMLPLSLAGLEKRKRRLMDLFQVKTCDDRTLIIKAREKGFI